ncbi:MAG: SDR family NAD(P)-dependent oxidoreductase, partial [Pseudomonadota bacterium]
ALIIGAGPGLSASLARLFHANGLKVTLASRTVADLADLAAETEATTHACDATDQAQVEALFEGLDEDAPDVLVYNPAGRIASDFVDLDPAAVRKAIDVTVMGCFSAAQQAAKRMVPNGHGAILITGASAGVKGYPRSATFAMGNFARRGLAQSLARELHPKGVHIGYFVIDGGIRNPLRLERVDKPDNPDSMLCPDAIARSYWHFLQQDRSCWSWEMEVRPWVERF